MLRSFGRQGVGRSSLISLTAGWQRLGLESAVRLDSAVLAPLATATTPLKGNILKAGHDPSGCGFSTGLAGHSLLDPPQKQDLVRRLLRAKEASGKTFTQISNEVGLTNAYTAQLFYNQAQLQPNTVERLRHAVPTLTDDMIEEMRKCPMRSYDDNIKQEPHIYRMTEAVLHYGQALKAILNEECGDGIMSAIDLYMSASKVTGANGETRFVVTLNGKFLPYNEQRMDAAQAITVKGKRGKGPARKKKDAPEAEEPLEAHS